MSTLLAALAARLENDAVWHACWIAAAVLRLAAIAWSGIQDTHFALPYTDVDYHVVCDAARLVAAGDSPYNRLTYRYTPFLAWLLLPATALPVFGKLLFAAGDLLVGLLLLQVAPPEEGPGRLQQLAMTPRVLCCLWLFNPLTVALSSRGSCEALVALSLLLILEATRRRAPLLMGIAWAWATHFKLFPVVFAWPMYLILGEGPPGSLRRLVPDGQQARFVWSGAAALATLTALGYAA
jgi:phosphatidylinositol glycan class M